MKLKFWKSSAGGSDETPGRAADSGTAVCATAKPKRILMVDDEESFARMTKRNLEATGAYEVETVHRAKQAVAAAQEFNPDLILLDVMMPDGDGGEVASALAADAGLESIPVLFLTAAIKGSEVGQRGAGYIGGRFYIAKPVDADRLIRLIEEHSKG